MEAHKEIERLNKNMTKVEDWVKELSESNKRLDIIIAGDKGLGVVGLMDRTIENEKAVHNFNKILSDIGVSYRSIKWFVITLLGGISVSLGGLFYFLLELSKHIQIIK